MCTYLLIFRNRIGIPLKRKWKRNFLKNDLESSMDIELWSAKSSSFESKHYRLYIRRKISAYTTAGELHTTIIHRSLVLLFDGEQKKTVRSISCNTCKRYNYYLLSSSASFIYSFVSIAFILNLLKQVNADLLSHYYTFVSNDGCIY